MKKNRLQIKNVLKIGVQTASMGYKPPALTFLFAPEMQASDNSSRIEVTFDLDANGLLTASARDMVSNKKSELQLDYNNC